MLYAWSLRFSNETKEGYICGITIKNQISTPLCTEKLIFAIILSIIVALCSRLVKKSLAVIQQRFDKVTKSTKWTELDPWLTDDLYLNHKFKEFFDERAGTCTDGLYPTVTIRQIMWALKMKPLPRQRWETVFDRWGI